MTLLQMRTLLRKMIGNPVTADVADSELTDRLNEAVQELLTKYKFHKGRKLCTFSTIAGTAKYALPTDCYAVKRVRDNTNKRMLIKAGDTFYASRNEVETDEGKPIRYIRYRDWLTFVPTPDAVYTMELWYAVIATAMALDGDVSVLPETWHIGAVRLARGIHFDLAGDIPKAKIALDMFDRWVATMPLEIDVEAEHIDSAVDVMSLSGGLTENRLDFDHED